MGDIKQCCQCGRLIKGEPVKKVLRGCEHLYCSDFCFRFYFYGIKMPYSDLQKMYSIGCVSVPIEILLKRAEGKV